MSDFTWTHLLYRLYDADDQLLYIGRTNNLKHRFNQHSGAQPWWGDVARSAVETQPDLDALKAAEKAAILAEKPKHNIVYNGRVLTAGADPIPAWITINPRVSAAADEIHVQCRTNQIANYPDEFDEDDYMPPCDICALKAVDVVRAIDAVTGTEDDTVGQSECAIIHEASARELARLGTVAVARIGVPWLGKCLCESCVEGWAQAQKRISGPAS